MLKRLLKREEMEEVYQKVERLSINREDFIRVTLAAAFPGWRETELTPKKYEAWQKLVLDTSEKLAKLLEGTHLDKAAMEFCSDPLSHILRNLKFIQSHLAGVTVERPAGSSAARSRISKALRCLLKPKTKKPYTNLIVITISVALDDTEITAKQVRGFIKGR